MKKLIVLISAILFLPGFGFAQSIKALNSFHPMKLKVTQDYLGKHDGDHYFISTVGKRLVVTDDKFRHQESIKLPMKKKSRLYSDWVKIIDDRIYIAYSLRGENFIKIITRAGALVKDIKLRDGKSSNITDNNTFCVLDYSTGKVYVYKVSDEVEEIFESDPHLKNMDRKEKKATGFKLFTHGTNSYMLVTYNKKNADIYYENYETGEVDEVEVELPNNVNNYTDFQTLVSDDNRLIIGILNRIDDPSRKRNQDEYDGITLHVYNTSGGEIEKEETYKTTFSDELIDSWIDTYGNKKWQGISSDLLIEQVYFKGDDVYVMMNVTDLYSTTTTTTTNSGTTTSTTWTRTNKAILISKFTDGDANTIMIKRYASLSASGSSIIEQRAKSCKLVEYDGQMYVLYNKTGTRKEYDKRQTRRVIINTLDEDLNLDKHADLYVHELLKGKYPMFIDFNTIIQDGDTFYFYGILNLVRTAGGVVKLTLN